MIRRNLVLAIFFFIANICYSQNSKWENFTDFKNTSSIASNHTTSKIYCGSNGGLYVVDPATGKVTTNYTNLNGLINNEITSLTIDNSNRLWVGASDGSISILDLQSLTWKYIFDIKNSTETNKSINFLLPSGNFMFVATGYGIQKISASNFNFVDAPYYKLGGYPVSTPVYALTINNNILYAASKTGVAYANYVQSNLNNPQSWTTYNVAPMNAEVRTIETYDNKIFAGSLTGFSYFDGVNWMLYPNGLIDSANLKFIKSVPPNLYFIADNTIFFTNSSDLSLITQFESSDDYTTLDYYTSKGLIAGLSDNGIFIKINNSYDFVYPNSPFTNIFNKIVIDSDNNIWATGGIASNGFYKFDGTTWTNYLTGTHPQIGNSNWFQKIAYGNGIVWTLGYGGGPTKIQGNTITNFNTSNSSLPGISNDPNFCATYGGAYDNVGVFWLTFLTTDFGRSVYAYDLAGNWIGFTNPAIISSASLSEVAVDSYNTKWIVSIGGRPGLYFFNENGSLNNPQDDVFGIYDNVDFGTEITNVTDVIVEKNNEVWVSTNNGVFIINNPLAAIVNPNQKPRPQKLGLISGNLKVPFTENCLCLTNDILNEKWIGTESNGVFHLSADGSTLIEQLNTSKTPILANRITTIEVSNRTGRAYFGSQKGLSSYTTDAIEPVADFDELIASPNPYIVPSNVGLKIDGLIENSIIKIITLSGEVINEFDSPGGRIAFWDGRKLNDELASTGIYIIVAYNKDGSKVGTGKVALVKR